MVFEELACPSSLSPSSLPAGACPFPHTPGWPSSGLKVGLKYDLDAPHLRGAILNSEQQLKEPQQCPKALPSQLSLLRAPLGRLVCVKEWSRTENDGQLLIKMILLLLLPWFADVWPCAWCYLNKIPSHLCTCICRAAAPVTEQDIHWAIALLLVQTNIFYLRIIYLKDIRIILTN